jgi:hypothetical protein
MMGSYHILIDEYELVIQSHPALTEQDRKKLCRVMDVQALSLSACTHAASNERLPLRFVVQVIIPPLFFGQDHVFLQLM